MRFMFVKFKKEIIDYLLLKPFGYHNNIVDLALYNRLDLFEIVYSETKVFNGIVRVVDLASFNFKCLTALGGSCSTYAMDWAAEGGHLDIVQWLHFNRSEGCTTSAMDLAARNGHLDVVKWLHLNRYEGCPTFAMRSKHIAIVRYLVENGLVTDRQGPESA